MPKKSQCQVNRWKRKLPPPPWICWYCSNLIWKKGGNTKGTLIGHHRRPMDESSIVPVHKECHSKIHGTICAPGCNCHKHDYQPTRAENGRSVDASIRRKNLKKANMARIGFDPSED